MTRRREQREIAESGDKSRDNNLPSKDLGSDHYQQLQHEKGKRKRKEEAKAKERAKEKRREASSPPRNCCEEKEETN